MNIYYCFFNKPVYLCKDTTVRFPEIFQPRKSFYKPIFSQIKISFDVSKLAQAIAKSYNITEIGNDSDYYEILFINVKFREFFVMCTVLSHLEKPKQV